MAAPWAERALVVRAARIALDVGDLAVDGVHERGAANGAVRADARVRLGVLDPQLGGRGQRGSEVGAESRQAAEGGAAGPGRDADEVASREVHPAAPLSAGY